MKTLLQKLSSRKLWAAVVGVVTGLAMVFGLDEDIITTVSGAVVSVASLITYIISEGKIDAARVKQTIELAQKAKDAITGASDAEQ